MQQLHPLISEVLVASEVPRVILMALSMLRMVSSVEKLPRVADKTCTEGLIASNLEAISRLLSKTMAMITSSPSKAVISLVRPVRRAAMVTKLLTVPSTLLITTNTLRIKKPNPLVALSTVDPIEPSRRLKVNTTEEPASLRDQLDLDRDNPSTIK